MKRRAITVAATLALSTPSVAAGIDSRAYTCAALHSIITIYGFVFISQPAFGDFVVANASFCGGGAPMETRSVPTADAAECPVNYCNEYTSSETQ